MKKIYLVAILLIVANFVNAQIVQTSYRGAFAPGVSMWTDNWTNWNPKNEPYTDGTVVNVTANITANTTWTTGKTYYISGLIYVKNNATLTIQPGVVVKGVKTSTGTALVVTKGAKLNAIGTAASPIVFTSAKSVTDGRAGGDWGGIILLGKSTFNLNNGINYIEGITASVDTEYGGGTSPDENDNSGTLKYVRIEFGGFVFSPNNEINGLTFGAVGRGTTIDNVQVSFAGDDSFEWFGGTVNCKHLVAYRGLDDDFDTDNGFSGICQFGLGIKDPQISDNPAISTSEGFESDNNANGTSVSPYTSCVFTNYTMIGPKYRQTLTNGGTLASGFKKAARLRRNSKQKIFNSIFLDFAEGLHVDGNDAELNAMADQLKWKNNIIGIYAAGSKDYKFLQVTNGSNTLSTSGSGFNMTSWYGTTGYDNISSSVNTGILAKAYDLTNAQNYSGLDYSPAALSPALSGASFTDASLSPYVTVLVDGTKPTVTNLTYCKGTVAAPLTANLATGGVSLNWYATAVIKTPLAIVFPATAPIPATATVGKYSYYVSQTNADGTESERTKLDVTTTASPLVALGTITGAFTADPLVAAPVAVGPYVGTTTQFTYTVPASTESGVSSYLWTVPSGVNIISTIKNTNSITVNFANVPAGAGALGSIMVQAVNGGGCPGAAKTLALTKALPVAPAKITLTEYPSTTAVVNYAKYMNTSTPLTLTAAPVVTATSYKWELPTGVNAITSGTSVDTKVIYTAEPFITPGTAPGTVGTKYWEVTNKVYTVDVNNVSTKVTVSTANQIIVGSNYTFTLKNNSSATKLDRFTYNGDLYEVTSTLVGGKTLVCKAIYDADTNVVDHFLGAGDTSVDGTLTFSTGNAGSTKSIAFTKIGFYGKAKSAAYPVYGTVVTSDKPAILVDFKGVTSPLTTKLYLGVKSKNGVGVSTTTNASNVDVTANTTSMPGLFSTVYTETFVAPVGSSGGGVNASSSYSASGFAASTAKLVALTATIPKAPGVVSGQIAGICATGSYEYRFVGSALANHYVITGPANSIISPIGGTNGSNDPHVLVIDGLGFTLSFPADYVINPADKSIVISAVNGVGPSALNKTVVLSTIMPAIGGVAIGSAGMTSSFTAGITSFTRCSTQTFTIPAVVGSNIGNYLWTVADGAEILSGQQTTTIEVDFSKVPTSKLTNIITVKATNGCGVSTAVKKITLANSTCPVVRLAAQNEVSSTEVYPNPTSGIFNVDVTVSNASVVEVSVYSFDGLLVVSPKAVKLQAGTNTISQDISSLNNGIYFVQIANALNNEIITKKMIKQ